VRIVTPPRIAADKRDRVLINLHGGGFNSILDRSRNPFPSQFDWHKSDCCFVSSRARISFPAGLDDAVAVYKELLKTYSPRNIGVYGTSAGAILTGELTAKLKKLNLPLPAATGIFSGMGDFSQVGDSSALFALNGFSGHLDPPKPGVHDADYYTGTIDLRDPCYPRSTRIFPDFLRQLLLPAAETCCSVAPPSCTALTSEWACTRSWWSLKLCPTPSGIILASRKREKPTI